MNEQARCSKCNAPLPSDAKEALCPLCLPLRPASGPGILLGILLLLLGAIWMLFWGAVFVSSISAMDRGGGREAVGDAVGSAGMAAIGLIALVAAVYLIRSAGRPPKAYAPRDATAGSEKRTLLKRSVIGGLIGFGVVSLTTMPVIPILNSSPIWVQSQVNEGLMRLATLVVVNGLPVVGAIIGVIIARRMRTRGSASRQGQGSLTGRSILGGLTGALAVFMSWLFVPPILVLAVLYRVLGLSHDYEDLVGFNLALVSVVMLAFGAMVGVNVARRIGTRQGMPWPEHVGRDTAGSPAAEPKPARDTHNSYPRGLIMVCGGVACLTAIFFWAHVPNVPEAMEPVVGVQPGEERTFAGIVFCWCPPGSFTMGSSETEAGRKENEGPQHTVTFEQGFWMSRYEVTCGQWESVEGFHPEARKGNANLPMQMVDWYECQSFLKRLCAKGAGIFRLPSEAEWEYACRAGTQTPFSFGETLSKDQANLDGFTSRPVGSFSGNAWNLCDMHGNVREWCQDAWQEDYTSVPDDGSAWESTRKDEDRVFRSAASDRVDRGVADRRSASRWHAMPGRHDVGLGFRIVRTP